MPYYVSIRDGRRHGLLVGPFRSHTEALAMVEEAREMAQTVDPRSVFCGFGTAKAETMRPGKINELVIGDVIDDNGYATLRGWPAWRNELNKRITGEQVGRKWGDWQLAMEADRRKINDYLFHRVRHGGCRGHLGTREMQRRYPEINNQEDNW